MSTESPAAPSVRQLALGDLEHEMALTRALLERVPDDRLDWKPHPNSSTLGGLALHVATLPFWIEHTVQHDHLDLLNYPRHAPPQSRQEILDAFEERVAAMRAALEGADDENLLSQWELRMGEKVLQALPKRASCRTMGLSHLIHHRAQLGVYLRLLDIPLPPMYGPSADEQPNFG